jgi:pimeloyl-ACP methyl ester carboxylesterase/DNA-binding CsgD family transcriptional regulator
MRGPGYGGCKLPAMAYPVRYVRTPDGVNIAHTVFGAGEPLVFVPSIPWANFSVMFSNPHTARHPEELGQFARVAAYDARGCGLSDHGVADLSLEAFARDIDAVADAAGFGAYTLYALGDGCRPAIHFAATRPERVSRLILWLPSVSPERLRGDQVMRAIGGLAYRDWDTYVRTLSHAVVGGWDTERAPFAAAFADVMRGGIRPGEFPDFVAGVRQHDVSDLLERVTVPTLALTREDAAVYTVDTAREVAAGIPGAELVCPPGNWLLPCTNDDITREIARFMGVSTPTGDQHSLARTLGNSMPGNGKLSGREWEVVELVALGRTNAEIAAELSVSHATASRHVHNILTKLDMTRRSELAAYAALSGRVPRPV